MRDGEAGSPAAGTVSPIAARLDRLPVTGLHWAIILVAALGLLFDVVEAALGNALSAVFSAPPHRVQPYQLSLLLASIFAGGAVGAPIIGWLADRHGRRLALVLSLAILTVTSLLAAASSDIAWLTVFRTLSGLALGAYPPLMAAYLADVLPPARRGMLILFAAAIGLLGAPAVVFLVRGLTLVQPFGLEAWRWGLIAGALGSALVAVAFRYLPESPRWLAARGRHDEAEAECRRFERAAGLPVATAAAPAAAPEAVPEAGPQRSLWAALDRAHRLRCALLAALFFLSPWVTIGFPLLTGAVLIEKGFRLGDSLLLLGVSMFGPAIGSTAAAFGIDRLERRTVLAVAAALMALSVVAFAAGTAPLPLMLAATAFNLIGYIYVSALNIYTAELFPTALRASVTASGWAVNRLTAAVVPLALLPLLKSAGPGWMFAAMIAALLASLALLLLFGPRGLARRPVA